MIGFLILLYEYYNQEKENIKIKMKINVDKKYLHYKKYDEFESLLHHK
jgi:hypothetical protein